MKIYLQYLYQDLNRCFPDWAQLGRSLGELEREAAEPEVAAVIRHLADNK